MLRAKRGLGWGSALALLVGSLGSACDEPLPPLPLPVAAADGGPVAPGESTVPVFIAADFGAFYQTFLLLGLSSGEKTERWNRYYKQRWVRWCGILLRRHGSVAIFRQLGGSGSYDVVVSLAGAQGQAAGSKLQLGRFYNYVGRLMRYDDSFHITNLDQGLVFDAGPNGVPGVLDELPELTRHVQPPPAVVPY